MAGSGRCGACEVADEVLGGVFDDLAWVLEHRDELVARHVVKAYGEVRSPEETIERKSYLRSR